MSKRKKAERRPLSSRGGVRGSASQRRGNDADQGIRNVGSRGEATCPDCAGVLIGDTFAHSAGCPVGVSIDAVVEEDRQWFAEHPGARMRWRPASFGERETARLVALARGEADPLEGSTKVEICVSQVRPGFRTRMVVVSRPRGQR